MEDQVIDQTQTPEPDGQAGTEAAELEGQAPSEETEQTPTGKEPEGDGKGDDTPKWAKKRFDELTRARYEEERKRSEAERRAAFLEGQLEASRGRQEGPAPAEDDPQPKAEQFGTYDDYIDARAAWKARQEFQSLKAKEQEESTKVEQERSAQEKQARFVEAIESAREKYQDFEDVAFSPKLMVTRPMLQAIQDADNSADLLYHLGKNPQEAARLAKLSPTQMVMELGVIAHQLKNPPKAEPKRISAGSPPVTTVGGVSKGADALTDDIPIGDWIARRNTEARKRSA